MCWDLFGTSSILKERSVSASSRPRIEDKLGLTSDNDEDEDVENPAQSESSDNSDTMDDTVIANRDKLNQAWDFELGENEVGFISQYLKY